MIILGKRDIEAGVVSVRKRGEGDLGAIPLQTLVERRKAETRMHPTRFGNR